MADGMRKQSSFTCIHRWCCGAGIPAKDARQSQCRKAPSLGRCMCGQLPVRPARTGRKRLPRGRRSRSATADFRSKRSIDTLPRKEQISDPQSDPQKRVVLDYFGGLRRRPRVCRSLKNIKRQAVTAEEILPLSKEQREKPTRPQPEHKRGWASLTCAQLHFQPDLFLATPQRCMVDSS